MRKMFSKNQIETIVNQGIEEGKIQGLFVYFAQCNVIDGETEYDQSYALLLSKDPNLQIIEGDLSSAIVVLQLTIANDDDTYYAVNPELTLNSDYLTFTDGGFEDITDPVFEYTSISKIL